MILDFYEKLQPVFQPIVSLKSNKIDHYESLMRFKNPKEVGFMPVYKYIEGLEISGKILDLDTWMLSLMAQKTNDDNTRRIAINISGQTISDPRYFSVARDILFEARNPSLIQFEITETRPITALGRANHFIEMVNDFGCKVSVDDYGTGFSSAHYLKNLPVNEVKIDGKYISGLLDSAVNRAFIMDTVRIARKSGITTVAEFIEDIPTLDVLRSMGVDCGQGFLFSAPSIAMTLDAEIRHNINLSIITAKSNLAFGASSEKIALSM